jgi:hypothetical protein
MKTTIRQHDAQKQTMTMMGRMEIMQKWKPKKDANVQKYLSSDLQAYL